MAKTNKAKPKSQSKKVKIPKGLKIHSEKACEGQYCPFHNPSNHHMIDWKLHVRDDKYYLVERICPEHGVGHPDPDSLAYFVRIGKDWMGVHGCCGCCFKGK
jgi:hypothetical protein